MVAQHQRKWWLRARPTGPLGGARDEVVEFRSQRFSGGQKSKTHGACRLSIATGSEMVSDGNLHSVCSSRRWLRFENRTFTDRRTDCGLGATTRAQLLTILFNFFPQPDKILTDHLVNDVVLSPTGVFVNSTNGKSFKGDIVVGADDIHSTTRGIMWKQASKISPG
jgi:2-polyprenyl-6-methoxyphenol hydroxylase-like FAD-dependent oxidoreductase